MWSALLARITLSVLRSVVDAFTLEDANTLMQSERLTFYYMNALYVLVNCCRF